MEKSKLKSILLLLVIALFSVTFVSAAASILEPASGTIAGNTVYYNISLNANITAGAGNFSCILYVSSAALTANTTWQEVDTVANNSIAGPANGVTNYTNGSFDSTGFEDADDYRLNATCSNDTVQFLDDVNTGYIFDNHVPTTPTELNPAAESTDEDGDITFASTISGNQTISCILWFTSLTPGAPSYNMTLSGNNCTYSLTSISEETYEYYVTATDGTNTSQSATTRFSVDSDSSGGYFPQETVTTFTDKIGGDKVVLVVIVISIIGLLYWLIVKK